MIVDSITKSKYMFVCIEGELEIYQGRRYPLSRVSHCLSGGQTRRTSAVVGCQYSNVAKCRSSLCVCSDLAVAAGSSHICWHCGTALAEQLYSQPFCPNLSMYVCQQYLLHCLEGNGLMKFSR